ncbi:MAG: T9SS type A sorting domain-containing protein [Candidatus Azobacteroides sp.]|nr:T9SS type A sorting domain-containing protein [Candidatus Azobacteroides sp.]
MEPYGGSTLNVGEWRLYSALETDADFDSHLFIVQDAGDGYYRLINKQSDLLLEVLDGIYHAGRNVWQITDINQPGGLWKLQDPEVLSVNRPDGNDTSRFTVYPNPAEYEINLNISESWSGSQLTIYNVSGVSVYSGTVSAATVDISNLTPGYYIVKISKDNEVKIANFIKK